MRTPLITAAAIISLALSARAQTPPESKLDLAPFGLAKAPCAWYPGRVEFLDDDHLVVSAPISYPCSKAARGKPVDTQITTLDLQGHRVASIRRTDVVDLIPGPSGYAAICTGDRLELLSPSLQVTQSYPLPADGKLPGCNSVGRLSPSRTAFEIKGPAASQAGLYQTASAHPIANLTTSRGQSVKAVADDGFLLCKESSKRCDVVGPHGVESSFPMPELRGDFARHIVGMVAPNRLLLASLSGDKLYAETPAGESLPMGDTSEGPTVADTIDVQLSATEPRRILYSVEGCPTRRFRDCEDPSRPVVRHFAVFDSQTSRMLFRHTYGPGANLQISPNGHLVIEQDGPQLHLFRIP